MKNKKLKSERQHLNLKALMSAALALPGLALEAKAQTISDSPEFRFEYGHYRERQSVDINGRTKRIRINAPQIWFKAPLLNKTEVEAILVLDSVSGASPIYLSTLSGASAKGVSDIRRAGDIKFTQYFDSFSLGLAGSVSNEDDYFSRAGSLEFKTWSNNKNSVYSFGLGRNWDEISSSDVDTLDRSKFVNNFIVGTTQVIDRKSTMQLNLQYSNGQGFFDDPYKFYDQRPSSREFMSLLFRYRRYFEENNSALHFDYRIYKDSWDVVANMWEASWYKPLADLETITLRPSLRYYTQSDAEFFSSNYPPIDFESNYSSDQRLSDFGSLTLGLKLIKEFSAGVSVDIKYEYMLQKTDLKLGGGTDQNIEPLYTQTIVIGFNKKF